MKSLIEFIQEQDLINYSRLTGHGPPWTDDKVLQEYKFGNVRREFDRTNRLLFSMMRQIQAKSKLEPLLVQNAVIHRMVSCFDFSDVHGFFETFGDFKHAYNFSRRAGFQVRPASFMTCSSDAKFLETAALVFDVAEAWVEELVDTPWLQAAFEAFRTVLGKFTAWQAALDTMMYGWTTNETEFVHIGPGAATCMRLLEIEPQDYSDVLGQVNDHLRYLPLRYEELEGLFCEYSRYVRYQTKFPGRYRIFIPDSRPLIQIPLDKVLNEAMSAVLKGKIK